MLRCTSHRSRCLRLHHARADVGQLMERRRHRHARAADVRDRADREAGIGEPRRPPPTIRT